MAPARPRPLDVALDVLVVLVLVAGLLWCLSLVAANGFGGTGIAGLVGALVACAVLLSYGRTIRTRRTTQAR